MGCLLPNDCELVMRGEACFPENEYNRFAIVIYRRDGELYLGWESQKYTNEIVHSFIISTCECQTSGTTNFTITGEMIGKGKKRPTRTSKTFGIRGSTQCHVDSWVDCIDNANGGPNAKAK